MEGQLLSDFLNTKKLGIVQQSSRLAVLMKLSGMVDLKGQKMPPWLRMYLKGMVGRVRGHFN